MRHQASKSNTIARPGRRHQASVRLPAHDGGARLRRARRGPAAVLDRGRQPGAQRATTGSGGGGGLITVERV